MIVVNDGSSDSTSERARAFESSGRVVVVDRPPEVAGRGKGAALNEGYRVLRELLERATRSWRAGDPDEVVVGIIDADGTLEPDGARRDRAALRDPQVGGVQMGVIIGNARRRPDRRAARTSSSWGSATWPRPHGTGSARSGSAATASSRASRRSASSDRPPWSDCLTEDLDLGLHLTRLGWTIRFCRTTSVTQQGVRTVRAWLRQRTRWAQGHYQCWDHVPRLLTRRERPLWTRLDLVLYLLFVAFVMFVAANLAVRHPAARSAASSIVNEFLAFLPAGPAAQRHDAGRSGSARW